MKRSSVFTLLVVAPPVAGANEARSSFVVTVQVAPRAQLETIAEPAGFEVSVEDATRGYVDVTALYRVRNNDPGGYVVRLEPRVGLAAAVEVAGLASPVVMRDEVVEVTEPAALAARDLNLRYRIVLGAGVPPATRVPPPSQLRAMACRVRVAGTGVPSSCTSRIVTESARATGNFTLTPLR